MNLAIAILSAALAFPRQEIKDVRVACTVPPRPDRKMRVEGIGPLKDGTQLKIILTPLYERVEGDKILASERNPLQLPRPYAIVKDRRFKYELENAFPGLYRVFVRPRRAPQDMEGWTFTVWAWDETLPDSLAPELRKIDKLVENAASLVLQCGEASRDKNTWRARGGPVLAGFMKLQALLEEQQRASLLGASITHLSGVVNNLFSCARKFSWDDVGKLVPQDHYGKKQDFRGKTFDIANYAGYVAETKELAGREAALWLMKEYTRRRGLRRLDNEGLKKFLSHVGRFNKHPTVGPYTDRLLKLHTLKPEELEALENKLRGIKKNEEPGK